MNHSPFNPKSDRKRALTDFRRTLSAHPYALLCFCGYATWMILVFQSSALLPSAQFFGWSLPGWLPPMACMALTSFLFAIAFWVKRFVIPRRALLIAMGTLMTGGALCFAFWLGAGDVLAGSTALFFVGSLSTGMGTALLYIEVNRLLGQLGMRKTGFLAIAAMAASSLLTSALSFAPLSVKLPVIVALPLAVVALYRKAIAPFPPDEYLLHGIDARLYFPWKYLVTSFLQGVSLGIVSGSVVFLRAHDLGVVPNALGCVLACVLFLVTITFLKLDFNRLIYQIGFPLMACGFYLIGLLAPIEAFGGLLQMLGYYFVDLAMWCLGSYLIKNCGLPATWIAMGPSCSLFIGTMAGGLLGWLASGTFPYEGVSAIMNGTALLLLVSALLLANEDNFKFGWGTLRPISEEDEIDWIGHVCAYLESEYALTARQADMLRLLTADYSRKEIADELFVSEDTVKTHIRNLYQKLSVHSQKELMELAKATSVMLKIEARRPSA